MAKAISTKNMTKGSKKPSSTTVSKPNHNSTQKTNSSQKQKEKRKTNERKEEKVEKVGTKDLFDNHDDEEVETLKINQTFAEKYDQKKKNEELSRLKSMYGDGEEESESSDDEPEDEDGELVTAEVDKQIFKTLSLIKAKDPSVYNPEIHFFSEKDAEKSEEQWNKKKELAKSQPKPMYLKDYERKVLLEDGGIIDEEKELDPKKPLNYFEEQDLLKKSFKIKDDSDSEEDFFEARVKTQEEIEEEELDFKNFLSEQKTKEDTKRIDEFESLRRYWTDPNIDSNEKFLRDYVLNRDWVDKNADYIPTYDEVVEEEDEKAVEEMEEFERAYNFRHEEEGGTQLVAFSRNIPDLVRRTDDKRKVKRQQVNERKKEETEKKKEELKRLKNLKKKEILDKLQKIEKISGASALGFEDLNLEGDFDPEEYDKQMSERFNDDYYLESGDLKDSQFLDEQIDEIIGEDDNENEKFLSRVKSMKKSQKNKEEEEEEEEEYDEEYDDEENEEEEDNNQDFIMDADYLPGGDKYEGKPEKKSKKKKDLSKIQGNNEAIDQLLDEYYQLNFEDFAGGKPTRFRYRKVMPDSYGLTPMEILLADEKDLNEHISLKKLAPYRPEEKQERDRRVFSKAKRVKEFKRKLEEKIEKEELFEKLEKIYEKNESQKKKNKKLKVKEKKNEKSKEKKPKKEIEKEKVKSILKKKVPTKNDIKSSSKKSDKVEKINSTQLSKERLSSYLTDQKRKKDFPLPSTSKKQKFSTQ